MQQKQHLSAIPNRFGTTASKYRYRARKIGVCRIRDIQANTTLNPRIVAPPLVKNSKKTMPKEKCGKMYPIWNK